jgi:hypothetical protein
LAAAVEHTKSTYAPLAAAAGTVQEEEAAMSVDGRKMPVRR